MSKHTPTPWYVEGCGALGCDIDAEDENGIWTVAHVGGSDNAAFIVKAVNNHDALVAALRKAGECLESCGIMADSNNDGATCRQAAEGLKVVDAALAAVGAA